MTYSDKEQLGLLGGVHNTKHLRILIATEYLPPYVSGISNRCKNWIQGYRALGHHVTVASVRGTDCDITVPSICNPWYRQQRIFVGTSLILMFQLLNFMTPIPYDVVHVVSPLCLAFIPLLPLFWLRGVQIYISHHVFLEYYQDHYIPVLLRGIVGKGYVILFWLPLVLWASVVGIPSKTADGYVYAHARQIHYLRSGVDTTVFDPKRANDEHLLPPALKGVVRRNARPHRSPRLIALDEKQPRKSLEISRRSPVLLYVGRLAAEKNVDFLIRALAQPALQSATLILVGDGPSRGSLTTLAREVVGPENVVNSDEPPQTFYDTAPSSSPRARVVFTGMIQDERTVAAHYALSDVFLSASESETFGFTVTEAMACGTPPVMVRAGAFATVFKQLDAFMFEPADMAGLLDKIEDVLTQGKELRRDVRRRCERDFSIDASVRDLIGVYESICAARL